MVNFYWKPTKENPIRELEEFKVGAWIRADDPSETELSFLASRFSLDAGFLRDAVDIHEAPRLEVEGDTVYVFLRVPFRDEGRRSTLPLLVVIREDFVMTISKYHQQLLDKFVNEEIEFILGDKTRFLMQIISEADSAYSKALNDISKSVRGISVKLERISNENIVQFITFEGELNDFVSALLPAQTILNNLNSGRILKLSHVDVDLLKDLLLSNGQLVDACKNTLRTSVNIRQAYSTIMSNNLNSVIKLLTAFTIVLAVPTMIASFYGMNVTLPFDDSPVAFFGILGISFLSIGVLLGIFIKREWL